MDDGKHEGVSIYRSDDDFAQILQFAKENNPIRYDQFDHAAVHRINLFALRENFDFEGLEEVLDHILWALPAIKRIFAKPIIRLKDTGAILPVEAVRVVNNETIVHASAHSELWENITEDGLLPRKLRTVQQEDNYSIYENLVFARTVNIIRQFVGGNMRRLTNMLYASRDMKFNLLERVNHPAYFLAIGKLHIGYLRDYDKYRAAAEHCLDKLFYIDRVIRARLSSPVYRQCKRYSGNLPLKKTNVFRMHKDYHRIYLLFKWFGEAKIGETDEAEESRAQSGEGYGLFCSMLSLFAVGHFNFTFHSEQSVDFYNLMQQASFSAWSLCLETVFCQGISALRFTVAKDRPYRILLLPSTDPEVGRQVLSLFRREVAADEYLLASFREEGDEHICLSLHDIESFRRLQQLLLRGMIEADTRRDLCPFCGEALAAERTGGEVYGCSACRTQILHLVCPETNRPYVATAIKNYRPSTAEQGGSARRDSLLYHRLAEAQMHFRNVTAISDGGRIVCPHCKKSH